MNRTIKEATVKRYYYDSHDQLKTHLQSFLMAYNFARRLKTLKELPPYEFICASWQKEPERFTVNPLHHTVGLNNRWISLAFGKNDMVEKGHAWLVMPGLTRRL